jgi:hypothetical protein
MIRQECQGQRLASALTIHDLQACFVDPSSVYPYICLLEPSGVAVFFEAISCTAEKSSPGRGGYVVGIQPVGGQYLDERSALALTATAQLSIREDLRRSSLLVAILGTCVEGGDYVEKPLVNHYVLAIAVRKSHVPLSEEGAWQVAVFDPNGGILSRAGRDIIFKMLQQALPELPVALEDVAFGQLTKVNTLYQYMGDGVCFMGPCTDLRLLIELWAQASPDKAQSGREFLIRGAKMLSRMRYRRKIHPVKRLLNLINPHLHPDDRKRELKYVFRVEAPMQPFNPRNPSTFAGPTFGGIHPDEWKRRVRAEIQARTASRRSGRRLVLR